MHREVAHDAGFREKQLAVRLFGQKLDKRMVVQEVGKH